MLCVNFNHELAFERLPQKQVERLLRRWRYGVTLERKARERHFGEKILAAVQHFAASGATGVN